MKWKRYLKPRRLSHKHILRRTWIGQYIVDGIIDKQGGIMLTVVHSPDGRDEKNCPFLDVVLKYDDSMKKWIRREIH